MASKNVSIALTTYNGARFLSGQLDSIYAQTYTPMEVVAVDDMSDDATQDILEEYHRRCGLTVVANTERLGFVQNFGKAISLCSGEYIALADQDDIWLPQKLETLISQLGDRSLVCSDFSLIDGDGSLIAPSFRKSLQIPIPDQDKQFHSLAFINFVQGCTCLFRNEFKKEVLPIPTEAMSHDWWLGIRATQFNGIAYVDQPLVQYRQHDRNTLGAKELWKFEGRLRYAFSRRRSEIMVRERDRISYYLKHGVYSNDEQRVLLEDLYSHYDSMVNSRIHFRAFAIAVRHRRLLLPNISPISRWMYLLGRLV